MKVPFELNAKVKGANGSLSPIILRISAPEFEEGRGHFCTIECPFIREKEMKAFGVDENQAIELAFDLVRSLLAHKEAFIVDDDGNRIEVPWA